MVPLLILASGCTSALQGTHLPYHFLLFCTFQVRSVNQQRRSASILSTDHKCLARMIPGSVLRKYAHPDFGLFLTKPSSRPCSGVVHCWMSQCSQAFKPTHGCLILLLCIPNGITRSHGRRRNPAQWGGDGEKSAPAPAETPPRTPLHNESSLLIMSHSQLISLMFFLPLLWCKLEERNVME